VDVVSALARVGGHLRKLFPLGTFATPRALAIGAETHLEQMLKAGVVVREHLHKLNDRNWLGHDGSPYLRAM
jgi:hypothetical protein